MKPNEEILEENIAALLGVAPGVPAFDGEARAATLEALHLQQAAQTTRSARPSLLSLIARVVMVTAAVLVVAKLFWSAPEPRPATANELEQVTGTELELRQQLKAQINENLQITTQLKQMMSTVNPDNFQVDEVMPQKSVMSKLEADLVNYEVEMITRKARLDELKPMDGEELLLSINYLLFDRTFESVQNRLREAEQNLAVSEKSLGARHPEVLQQQAGIALLEKQLAQGVVVLKKGLVMDYKISKKGYDTLAARLAQAKERGTITKAEGDIIHYEVEMIVRKTRLDELEAMEGDELLLTINYLTNGKVLVSVQKRLRESLLKLAVMEKSLGPRHPEYLQLQAGIVTLQAQLDRGIVGLKKSLVADYNVSKKRYETLVARLEENNKRAAFARDALQEQFGNLPSIHEETKRKAATAHTELENAKARFYGSPQAALEVEVRASEKKVSAAKEHLESLNKHLASSLDEAAIFLNTPKINALFSELQEDRKYLAEVRKEYGQDHRKTKGLISQITLPESKLRREVELSQRLAEVIYRSQQRDLKKLVERLREARKSTP